MYIGNEYSLYDDDPARHRSRSSSLLPMGFGPIRYMWSSACNYHGDAGGDKAFCNYGTTYGERDGRTRPRTYGMLSLPKALTQGASGFVCGEWPPL